MNSNVLSTLTLPVWLFCLLGLIFFGFGFLLALKTAIAKNKGEEVERVIAGICLMVVGIGIWVGLLTAKTIGLL